MHFILTALCVTAMALIIWAACRYVCDCQKKKRETLEAHRNKFIDTPE